MLAVTATVLWLGFVGTSTLLGADDLSTALGTARGRSVGPALVAVVAAMLVAERCWPAVPRPLLARAHLVDAGYLALFAVAVVPALTLVETGFSVEMARHAHFLMVSRLPLVPQVVVAAVILIGIDAMNWVAHVANHRSASLWRLHALHHSQEDMSVLTTFRTHPLVHATYLGALLPALVLGASGAVPAVAIIAYGCLVTLPHANLRWSFGPLGRILVSPAYHRLHHARRPWTPEASAISVSCWSAGIGWPATPSSHRWDADRDRYRRASGDCRAVGRRSAHRPSRPGTADRTLQDAQSDGRTVMSDLATRARQATAEVRATREAPLARDVALLVVRIALAWIFIYHGAGTLFGAFGQSGLHADAIFFANVAHLHPGTFFAVLSGVIEFFGGIAVGLGVLGRLAARPWSETLLSPRLP